MATLPFEVWSLPSSVNTTQPPVINAEVRDLLNPIASEPRFSQAFQGMCLSSKHAALE